LLTSGQLLAFIIIAVHLHAGKMQLAFHIHIVFFAGAAGAPPSSLPRLSPPLMRQQQLSPLLSLDVATH